MLERAERVIMSHLAFHSLNLALLHLLKLLKHPIKLSGDGADEFFKSLNTDTLNLPDLRLFGAPNILGLCDHLLGLVAVGAEGWGWRLAGWLIRTLHF